MSKVLFIGLGTMGFHMAGHLSKHYDVTVYNRTNKKSLNWASKYNGSYIESLSQINHKFDFVSVKHKIFAFYLFFIRFFIYKIFIITNNRVSNIVKLLS